jgi:hypothetical protein
LRKDLIICFSLCLVVLTVGCATRQDRKANWELPPKPQLVSVDFEPMRDGYYVSVDGATNLADNVDELKAYIEKLELLIEKMQKYYK